MPGSQLHVCFDFCSILKYKPDTRIAIIQTSETTESSFELPIYQLSIPISKLRSSYWQLSIGDVDDVFDFDFGSYTKKTIDIFRISTKHN